MEFEVLQKVIAQVLNVDVSEVGMETTFTGDLGADSLDVFQMIMSIEEEFGIEIAPDRAREVSTVEEAVALIQSTRQGV